MRPKLLVIAVGVVVGWWVALPAAGQTLQQRIDDMRQKQSRAAVEPVDDRINIQARLRDIIENVDIEGARLRTALQWYSATTGIPIVIDWRAMENEGIDPEAPISLQMRAVPAGQLLGLIMRLAAPGDLPGAAELMYEATPWYIQIMTKRQADRILVVRVYEVGDLTMNVPNFDNAPSFDLNDALSNTNSGGSNSSGGQGTSLFGDREAVREQTPTREERGEQLAQLIRDTVEPTIWAEMGGPATIRYFNGRLIVSAPRYVHAQIGQPVIALDRSAGTESGGTSTGVARPAPAPMPSPPHRSNGVSAIGQ